MEENKEVFWRKNWYKLLLIFMIRFGETVLISMLPSLISVFLVIVSPNPNGRIWSFLRFFSLFVFIMGNCFFCFRYSVSRKNRKEFYIMNGAVYIIYAVITMLIYKYAGYMFCSITIAPLRGLETLGANTKTSLIVSHCIMMMFMVITEVLSNIYNKFLESNMQAEDIADIDIDEELENTVPTQKNKEVEFLSIEEMGEYIKQENDEIQNAILEASNDMPDKIIDEGFSKGNGEEIIYITPENPENDLDDDDFVPEKYEINENEMYSSDSLWNPEIYQGRTEGDAPILYYEEEDEDYLIHVDAQEAEQEHDEEAELLLYAKYYEEEFEGDYEDYNPFDEIPYTSENLWDKAFYKGRNKNSELEKETETESENEEELEWIEEVLEANMNPYEEYDSEKLWGDIRQGDKKIDISKQIEDSGAGNFLDETISKSDGEELEWIEEVLEANMNPYEEYDSENLWDNIRQGDNEIDTSEYIEEYDPENLWGNIVQGRGEYDEDEWFDELLEAEPNPYDEYDSDSLWSKEIYQGRKK